MDHERVKKIGDLLTGENENRLPPQQPWIDRHYHIIMLVSMVLELVPIWILVFLEWRR